MTLDNRNPTPSAGSGLSTSCRRDPDPVQEMATIDDRSQDNDPARPQLSAAEVPEPGFGPDGNKQPRLTGDPELGIDPREAAARLGNGD